MKVSIKQLTTELGSRETIRMIGVDKPETVHFLSDGSYHNAALIRERCAHAYTAFTFQFLEEFRALEKGARESKRGLWRPGD